MIELFDQWDWSSVTGEPMNELTWIDESTLGWRNDYFGRRSNVANASRLRGFVDERRRHVLLLEFDVEIPYELRDGHWEVFAWWQAAGESVVTLRYSEIDTRTEQLTVRPDELELLSVKQAAMLDAMAKRIVELR